MPEEEWSDEEDFSPNSEGYNVIPYSRFQEKASEWGNRMQERANKQADAKNFAKLAEKGASKTGSATDSKGSNSSFTSAVQDAKNAEDKSSFANNVQGKTLEQVASKSMPGGKMFVNQAKKLGPLGTILIIIGALVGIFAGTQSLAPFGLVANGLDQFNNLRTSMNKRTTYFNRFMLDRSRNRPITSRATIFSAEKFKVSKNMSNKLQKNNIFYIDTDDYEVRFLVYQDEKTGKNYAIAANDKDVDKLPSSVEIPDGDGGTKRINIETEGKMKIDDAMLDSDDFSNALDRGTRTMKGHIAGWFDDLSEIFHLKRIKASRNRFRDTSDVAEDTEIETNARKGGMNEDIRGESGDQPKKLVEVEEEYIDGDGNKKTRKVWREAPVETDSGVKKEDTIGKNRADVESEVSNSLGKKATSIAAAIGDVSNYACTAMKVYSAINAVIAGIHVANVINYVTGFLEAIQRTQTGDAGKNELSYYMTRLSEKGNTYAYRDGADGLEEYEVKSGTSSLESTAWNQFFSDGTVVVQADDPLAQKYNREFVAQVSMGSHLGGLGEGIGAAISAMGGAAKAYRYCLYLDNISETIQFIVSFFTGGTSNIIKSIASILFKFFTLEALSLAIQGLFKWFVPHIASWMAMDLIKGMAGEDAAYAINSGFNMYLGGQFQTSSGLPATKDTLMAHYRAQQEVIASEAEFERSEKSPFDATSKYTFLGSIVNSLMPIANTWSSPLSTVSKTMSTVGSAFSGLLPTAKADGEVVFETSLNYECANLKEIGVVGDAFCNPYFVTDMSTMSEDPADVFEEVANDDDSNFLWDTADEHDGNPEINPNSTLAKWVVSCASRDSSFGIVDSNVLGNVITLTTDNDTMDTVLTTGVSMIPFVGNVANIIQNIDEEANLKWATGEHCIEEKYKSYSRYSEDQRLMESAGIIEESAVVSFLNDYYEKNPVDDSYEGTIARYSGLTKDQVSLTLDIIDYGEWLANYNPTTYGPEKYEAPDNTIHFEETEVIASENVVLNKYIVYDDVKNKTKIA